MLSTSKCYLYAKKNHKNLKSFTNFKIVYSEHFFLHLLNFIKIYAKISKRKYSKANIFWFIRLLLYCILGDIFYNNGTFTDCYKSKHFKFKKYKVLAYLCIQHLNFNVSSVSGAAATAEGNQDYIEVTNLQNTIGTTNTAGVNK